MDIPVKFIDHIDDQIISISLLSAIIKENCLSKYEEIYYSHLKWICSHQDT